MYWGVNTVKENNDFQGFNGQIMKKNELSCQRAFRHSTLL